MPREGNGQANWYPFMLAAASSTTQCLRKQRIRKCSGPAEDAARHADTELLTERSLPSSHPGIKAPININDISPVQDPKSRPYASFLYCGPNPPIIVLNRKPTMPSANATK